MDRCVWSPCPVVSFRSISMVRFDQYGTSVLVSSVLLVRIRSFFVYSGRLSGAWIAGAGTLPLVVVVCWKGKELTFGSFRVCHDLRGMVFRIYRKAIHFSSRAGLLGVMNLQLGASVVRVRS